MMLTLMWVLNCRAHTDITAKVGHKRGNLLKLSLHLPQHVLCLLLGNDQGTGTRQLWERERRKEFHRKGLNWTALHRKVLWTLADRRALWQTDSKERTLVLPDTAFYLFWMVSERRGGPVLQRSRLNLWSMLCDRGWITIYMWPNL